MNALLYQGPWDDARADAIRDAAPGWEILRPDTPEALAAALPRIRAASGALDDAALAQAPGLEWLHSWAAGPDTQLTPAFRAHPAVLTCSKGNGAIPLAEHAMMLMLILNRDAPRWARAHADGQWDRFTHGELAGLTVGLLGLGNAGQDLARKALAFHMRCIGLRRGTAPVDGVDRLYTRSELHDFLAASDFVVVTAPLTPDTTGLLDEAAFRAMKPSAFFLSISRGGIADDDALYRAVDEGWIAGAGLDAHATEPLPEGDRFWTLKNTIITPHNGATSAATGRRGFEIFLDNLRRFASGAPLVNLVDEAAGY